MSHARKPCTAFHLSRINSVAALAFAFTACMAPAGEGGGQVAIDVSPLTLPGLGKVCYDLRVTNDIAGGGSTVWSAGNPAIDGPADTDALCSDAYGNGARGGLTFVGSCDASPKTPGDPGRTNSVTLWVDALYDTGGASISPTGSDGWQDPCPSGCTLETQCVENTDARVEFNLTILRQANQGFFDIGVNFEDIFCAAKVDCVDAQNAPLDLLFNPTTGKRDTTVVAALACTAGPSASATTRLYREDLVIDCTTGPDIILDPSTGRGNIYTSASPDPAADGVWQYAIYAGKENLSCGATSCNKVYWNVAIGLDESVDNCVLKTRMTAASGDAMADFETPAATTYPYVEVNVGLTNASGLVCGKHPLNGGNGVGTLYTAIDSTKIFAHAFDGVAFSNSGATTTSTPPPADEIVTLDGANSISGASWSDTSGRAHHATIVGAPTFSSSFGGYLDFNGTTQYATLAASDDFALGTNDFTVIAYIRTATYSADNGYFRRIFSLGSDGNRSGNFQLILDTATSAAYMFTTGGLLDKIGKLPVADNQWHQLVVTRTGTLFSLYVDGELDVTQTHTPAMTNLSTQPVIGRFGNQSAGRFQGSLARLSMLSRALTASQVAADYANFATRFGITVSACSAAETVLLDASAYTGSGSVWPDLSVNALSATLFDSPVHSSTFGGLFSFNGTTNYATLPNNQAFNLGTQDFTLITYLKTGTYGADGFYRRIFALGNDGNRASNLQLLLDTATGTAYMWSSAGVIDAIGTIAVANNAWHQVAITRRGNRLSLYVDGVRDVMRLYTGALTNNGTTPVIGRYMTSSAQGRFNGSLARVALLPCGMPDVQVAAEYAARKSRFSSP